MTMKKLKRSMKVTDTPRTWQEVRNHPAVDDVNVNPSHYVRYWIYLKGGYSAAADPHNIHQGNGVTVREAIKDVFPVTACECSDCAGEKK